MKIEQIYTGCLAQGAYYIQSEGEAAIIDPLREVNSYLKKAEEDHAQIKYIFETHFHADFVSGHITLHEKTRAPIIFGPEAKANFEMHVAHDGEEFKLGKITIKVLHTPGHTMESSCYLLIDEQGKDHAIFSGDTLFLGDVGRPDLVQKAADKTQEEMAGMLYSSLRNKIMPLADELIVYPGHGAGSACGKNLMKERMDTLGHQKEVNYALRANMTKEEFVIEVTHDLLVAPRYFPFNVKMNKEGYKSIDLVLKKGKTPLSPQEIEIMANETNAVILDVREVEKFSTAHIPKSIFIGLDGNFAPWVGELIVDIEQPIILVTPEGREEEAITRLGRIGFDNTLGYLKGGIDAWISAGKEIDCITSISAEALCEKHQNPKTSIFDVRKNSEYAVNHVEEATHTPLNNLNDFLVSFLPDNTCYLYCAGGYRSMIAASVLKSRGIHNLVNIQGGFNAIQKTNIPKIESRHSSFKTSLSD